MNREINDPDIRRKYGNNVILSKDNIKDIYFITFCNRFNTSEYIEWFLRKNYSKEEILKWNDEYVNLRLDEIDKLLLEEYNYENSKEITFNFSLSVETYTTNRETYIRIIETLKRYFNKYGYFSCYPIISGNIDEYEYPFDSFFGIFVKKDTYQIEKMRKSSGYLFHYVKRTCYRGLIPSLYFSNFNNLMNEVINDMFIPMLKNYKKPWNLMKENKLSYILKEEKDPNTSNLKLWFDEFAKENKIKIEIKI